MSTPAYSVTITPQARARWSFTSRKSMGSLFNPTWGRALVYIRSFLPLYSPAESLSTRTDLPPTLLSIGTLTQRAVPSPYSRRGNPSPRIRIHPAIRDCSHEVGAVLHLTRTSARTGLCRAITLGATCHYCVRRIDLRSRFHDEGYASNT